MLKPPRSSSLPKSLRKVKRQAFLQRSRKQLLSLLLSLPVVLGVVSLPVVLGMGSFSSYRVVQDWTQLQLNPSEEHKREFDASLEIVKAIVGGVSTIATIIGGVVLYLNFRVANKKAETAIKTVEIANRNAELTESRLITERFAKAVEQLGSDKIEVRLGSIYSLGRLMADSERDHWTIMQVLTAWWCSIVMINL